MTRATDCSPKSRNVIARLWRDECGAVLSTELVLTVTILGIGMVVGLVAVRNAVVPELADVAGAIAQLDQSFHYSGTRGHGAHTRGSRFRDAADFCQNGPNSTQCVNVNAPAGSEGNGGGGGNNGGGNNGGGNNGGGNNGGGNNGGGNNGNNQNNGHGNGDQDPPGNSGDNNNAENSENSGQGNSGHGNGGNNGNNGNGG